MKQIVTKVELTAGDLVSACSVQNGRWRGRDVQSSGAGRENGTGNCTVLTSTEYQKIILDALDSGQEESVETWLSCCNRKSSYCN